jgi:hypothetical protein
MERRKELHGAETRFACPYRNGSGIATGHALFFSVFCDGQIQKKNVISNHGSL